MARSFALAALLVAALASVRASAAADGVDGFRRARPASVGMSAVRLERLDRVLDAYVERGQLPGYQLLVARRGKLVHQRVRGSMDLEDGRPLRNDTIFRIYSMSKVITGAASLIAYERGLFLLHEPVSIYLPALAKPKVLRPDGDGGFRKIDARREITILDLLRHTSGLSYSFLAPSPYGDRYVAAGITPGLRGLPDDAGLGPTGNDYKATLADMVERLGELPLVIEPGSAWHYGVNMDVLGRLIEVTSGQSYPEFLREHLFEPLDMRDAGFHVPDTEIERFAACYGPTQDGGMRLLDAPRTSEYRAPPAMPGGGGGMVSTARDYMRFALMLLGGGELDGERVLSRKTVELMMANHLPEEVFGASPLGHAAARTYANGGRGVGFGLTGSVIDEPQLTGLPVSAGTFGWGGAASTFFWVDPVEQVAVVFMTQLVLSGTYPIRSELLRGVNAAIVD
jgi:CubicO group peptidase (beta-lactamase class C family)